MGRLADLERRAARIRPPVPVVKPALKELSQAIEDLQTAGEHLQVILDQLANAELKAEQLAARVDEFVQVVPVACLWTDSSGVILEANDLAGTLLNISRTRLADKPLLLFFQDRERFFEALNKLSVPGCGPAEIVAVIRPRERRPRVVRVTGRVLEHDNRWCWFLRAGDEIDLPPASLDQ